MNKFYIDCEFDGHNGPLLSMAVVGDTDSIHIEVIAEAQNTWVLQNVIPLMDRHKATDEVCCTSLSVGDEVLAFIGERLNGAKIVADSPVDIARFCQAISTDIHGNWNSVDGDLNFEVHDIACYPTDLPGAVQHNAWWDAMALKHKLEAAA